MYGSTPRCWRYVHVIALEEGLDLGVDGLLVGQLRESADVEPPAVLAVALEMGRGVAALPAIKGDARRAGLVGGGASTEAAVGWAWRRAVLRGFGGTGLDLDRTAQQILPIQLQHGAVGLFFGLQLDEAVRRVAPSKRVDRDVNALARKKDGSQTVFSFLLACLFLLFFSFFDSQFFFLAVGWISPPTITH